MLPTTDSAGAARLLQLHTQTVEERARQGIIPGCKPGRKWVFVVDDLVEWLRKETARQQAERLSETSAPDHPRRNPKPPLPKRTET